MRVNSVMVLVVLWTHAELASATAWGRSYCEMGELWEDFCPCIMKTQEENSGLPVWFLREKKIPWVDHKVTNALRQKHKACNKARKNDTTENWERFRSLRKHVNRLTRSNYRKYIRDTVQNPARNSGLS